jgi:hypothetical protein
MRVPSATYMFQRESAVALFGIGQIEVLGQVQRNRDGFPGIKRNFKKIDPARTHS